MNRISLWKILFVFVCGTCIFVQSLSAELTAEDRGGRTMCFTEDGYFYGFYGNNGVYYEAGSRISMLNNYTVPESGIYLIVTGSWVHKTSYIYPNERIDLFGEECIDSPPESYPSDYYSGIWVLIDAFTRTRTYPYVEYYTSSGVRIGFTSDSSVDFHVYKLITIEHGIMKKESGDGQEGDICKPLEPFVVSVESENGAPLQGDFQVDWQITNSPAGSGRLNGEVIEQEAAKVIFKRTLELGEKTGEYKTKATCANCTAGSPQEFTATAKCPDVTNYYQTAYADKDRYPYDTWCKYTYISSITGKVTTKNKTCQCDLLDNSNPPNITGAGICQYENGALKPNYRLKSGYKQYSIANKGCALTSMAMVAGRYGSAATPDIWNNFMTTSGGYNDTADVKWETLTNSDLLIETALYRASIRIEPISNTIPLANPIMDGYLAKCMPVIVKVINPNTASWHWVVVTKKEGNRYSINDPGYRSRTTLSAYGNKIYAIQVYEKNNGRCQ